MTETKKKTTVLVIQLSRLGDTLQSLMALRAAKQLYPELEIHFVAREGFADAVERVPWIHQVYSLPTHEMVMPLAQNREDETAALKKLARWVAPLASTPWDLIFNWSFSESSSYLTALLPARAKLGYSRRPDLTSVATDGWSHFVQAVVQSGLKQNIHLTDILTTQLLTALQIHIGDPTADAGQQPVTSKGFFSLEMIPSSLLSLMRESSQRFIGIQIGSGQSGRTWSAEEWKQWIEQALAYSSDTSLILMGGPDDIDKEQEIMNLLPESLRGSTRLHSIVGRAAFDTWASIVSRCQWVIAGDTAVLHLASVLGTRVLFLALQSPKWIETGPYGNGHYVITPAQSETTLSPSAVFHAWTYASGEWANRKNSGIEEHFRAKGFDALLDSIYVFRSKIRSTQDGGGVVYEPLKKQRLSLDDWSSQLVGHLARAWYCGWTPAVGGELERAQIGPDLVQNLRRLSESADVLKKICEQAKLASISLQQKTAKLRSDKIMPLDHQEELRDLAKKLFELEDLLDRLAGDDPLLLVFSRMARVLMHNLKGDRLSALGKESARSYGQLLQGIALMKEWIEYTMKLVKPAAVTPAKVIEFRRSET